MLPCRRLNGWGRTGLHGIRPAQMQTCGLNFSFATKATSSLLPVPETPVLPRALFKGHVAERRGNYAEIMMLIMGWQTVAKCHQHLQMSRNGVRIPHARECSKNSSVPRHPRRSQAPGPPSSLWKCSWSHMSLSCMGLSPFFRYFIPTLLLIQESSRMQRI